MSLFTDKTLLITGGTGSFGNAVLNRFLKTDIGEIRIFSRDEKKQDDMRHDFQVRMPEVADKIKFYIGDVRDLASVKNAMHGVDYIFHAAALKQVPSCEFFPIEAVKTNVLGTENVLTAAIEAGVKNVVCLSTDKAAYPVNAQLELLYIDDLVAEMLDALEGKEHHCTFDGINTVLCDDGKYCAAPTTHKVTLGEIVDLLDSFKAQTSTLVMPEIPDNSFAKKLYSTYLSYLPKEKVSFPLKMNCDDRGSFTELLKTEKCGQFSVNISKPGITKGQHWHHTKWEFFIVVAGHGLIQLRKIGTDEVLNFEVSGDKIEAIHMLPGYTHNIINLSETENLVTVMWANEQFEPTHPDTFGEVVE